MPFDANSDMISTTVSRAKEQEDAEETTLKVNPEELPTSHPDMEGFSPHNGTPTFKEAVGDNDGRDARSSSP